MEHDPKKNGGDSNSSHTLRFNRETCHKCGATRIDKQLGLEKTPEEYVSNMVAVFREVKRVLRKDGTVWLNIGDSYASQGGANPHTAPSGTGNNSLLETAQPARKPPNGLKPKDLVGIPWMLAFALRADGWYLRSDIIWHKPNPMPESVTDRPTKSHEYIFLLTKSGKYFYDAEAIKEEAANGTDLGLLRGKNAGDDDMVAWHAQSIKKRQDEGVDSRLAGNGFRNKRDVWTVNSSPFPEAHFATFPPDLIKPCIWAGTSQKGCCSKCGAPIERVLKDGETVRIPRYPSDEKLRDTKMHGPCSWKTKEEIGWQPTCKCNAGTKQCVVLDCFFGAGTTGLVAQESHCDCIGIELNPEYIEIAARRFDQDVLPFAVES